MRSPLSRHFKDHSIHNKILVESVINNLAKISHENDDLTYYYISSYIAAKSWANSWVLAWTWPLPNSFGQTYFSTQLMIGKQLMTTSQWWRSSRAKFTIPDFSQFDSSFHQLWLNSKFYNQADMLKQWNSNLHDQILKI